jgi:hypothetical protein
LRQQRYLSDRGSASTDAHFGDAQPSPTRRSCAQALGSLRIFASLARGSHPPLKPSVYAVLTGSRDPRLRNRRTDHGAGNRDDNE